MRSKQQILNLVRGRAETLDYKDKDKFWLIVASYFLEVLIDIRNLYAWHSGYLGTRSDEEQRSIDRIGEE